MHFSRGSILNKVDKLHLNRSSLRPKSSTVIHRWLFNQLTEIKFNGKAKEKSICCNLTLKLTGMDDLFILPCVTSKQLILGNVSGGL